ncbi:DNA-binding transcription repressor [Actinomortierella ambigua]|nr:DNA-binding transcription repressor [Actinomortierella ambigua]
MSLLQQRRKSRISLSDIDELARTGKVQLTANEVQLFHRKGILKATSLPAPPLTTINESTASAASPLTIQASATASFVNPYSAVDALKSLSSSATPSSSVSSSPPPRPTNDADSRKKRSNHEPVGVLSPQKQSAPLFHRNTFENTTSHLFPEVAAESSISSWRRHSTENALQPTPSSLVPPADLTIARRSSTSVIPSVVNTPLGQQTVLYAAASPAHTLYSLPYKTSTATLAEGDTAPPPQRSYSPPSPISPVRKRKSIPHRSPDANDQDISPGVIFQLPFGHWSPPMTAKASRETSLSSSFSSSSTAEITIRPPSPPVRTPSPGSTSAATIVMESSSSSLTNITVTSSESIDGQAMSTELPASTVTASSGITLSTFAGTTSNSIDVLGTSSDAVSASSLASSGLGIRVDNMPLTPPTTTCPEAAPVGGTPAPSSLALTSAPWTPVTPSNGFAPSVPSQPSETVEPVHQATSQSTAPTRDSSSPAAAEDPSQLPLKAQRQLSIRRQSLIPRPELDFVNGSGILPPASQHLDTRGGAHILSYPVLLSDMVQVALDDAHARGELDGHTEDADSDTGVTTANHRHGKSVSKRKRGGSHGRKRGSLSGQGQGEEEVDENDHDGEVHTFQHKRRRSSQALPTSALNDLASNNINNIKSSKGSALGSPVTLSNSLKAGRTNSRGGKLGRPRKPKMTGNRAYYSAAADNDSYDETERLDQTYEPSLAYKPQPSEIPPEEIEVAIRHTREMMMHMESSVSHGGISYHPTTLQPLLDATRHLQEQEGYHVPQPPHGHHQHQFSQHNHHHHHLHQSPGGRFKQSPVDDDETEDEVRPVRSNRGQSHRTYPGESDYYDEGEQSHMEDAEDSGSAREASPTKQAGAKGGNGKSPKSSSKPRPTKPKAGDNGDPSLKRKRQNKEAGGAEGSNAGAANKKRRPSSTAISGFSSVAYANNQKEKVAGISAPTSSGRSSRTGEKKTCLACKIQDTPCWRPSYKEGTSLCNSCGLRYKKVGVICLNTDCNYIPIKSEYANMEAERKRLGIAQLTCIRCEKAVHQPAGRRTSNAPTPAPGPSSSTALDH